MYKSLNVIIFCCLLVACGSQTDAEFLASAHTHLEQGDTQSALIETKNALRQNPENAEARVLLGRLQLMSGNAQAAEKELLVAKRLGVPEDVYLPFLSQAYTAQGKWNDLKQLPSGNLADLNKAEVLAGQGLAFLVDRDIGQASQLIKEAAELAPNSAVVLLAKARLQMASEQLADVRTTLMTVLDLEGKSSAAWSLLGDLERVEHHFEQSEAAYGKAIRFGSQPFMDRLRRAQVRIQMKKYESAQIDLDMLMKASPNHPLANFAQGQIQMANKNSKEALVSFEKTVRVLPKYAPALYAMALTHFQLRNFEQAEQYAYKFVAQADRSTVSRKILGAILFQNAKYTEAEEQMRNVLAQTPDDPAAMNLLASILFKQNQKAESVALLEKISKLYPESAYAQLRLGAGLFSEGKQSEGEALMEQASALNPEFHQADVVLILLNIQQKDFGQALSLAESFRDKKPDAVLPYNLLGVIYSGQKNLDAARQSFQKALSVSPGDLMANNSLAILAIRDENFDLGREHYQSILDYHENHLGTLMRLAALDALEKKQEPMLSRLKQAMDAHPDALAPRLILARYHLMDNQPNKIPRLFRSVEQEVKKSPEALFVLARAHLANKNYLEAKLTLESLNGLKPDSAQAQYLLAMSYAGDKNSLKMESALLKALDLRPDYVDARLSLVSYLVKKDPEQALPHLAELKKLAPDHPLTGKLEAVAQNKMGDPRKALDAYKREFEKSPTSGNMLLLARQHIYMENQSAAVQLLESWVNDHPEDVRARLFLANEYIHLAYPEARITSQYDEILKQQPENLVALNNLAWHLRDSDPTKALEYAQKAITLKPESATILDTLAVVRLNNDQIDLAQDAIRKALQLSPEQPSVRYHAAMIEHASGDSVSAFERLSLLLQDEQNFPQRAEAERLYESLRQ